MENNNNLNLLSNAELMALTLVKAVNNGNMFLALCLAFYLKDPSIDPDKVRFEEWFTEEKCEEVAAFVREILEECRVVRIGAMDSEAGKRECVQIDIAGNRKSGNIGSLPALRRPAFRDGTEPVCRD